MHRQRRPDADGLDAVVDPVKEQIEAPRAETLGLECFAELANELVCIAGNGLRRADRLGEAAADLDEVRRANRINRLAEASHGLIEAAAKIGTEAQDKRRS